MNGESKKNHENKPQNLTLIDLEKAIIAKAEELIFNYNEQNSVKFLCYPFKAIFIGLKVLRVSEIIILILYYFCVPFLISTPIVWLIKKHSSSFDSFLLFISLLSFFCFWLVFPFMRPLSTLPLLKIKSDDVKILTNFVENKLENGSLSKEVVNELKDFIKTVSDDFNRVQNLLLISLGLYYATVMYFEQSTLEKMFQNTQVSEIANSSDYFFLISGFFSCVIAYLFVETFIVSKNVTISLVMQSFDQIKISLYKVKENESKSDIQNMQKTNPITRTNEIKIAEKEITKKQK